MTTNAKLNEALELLHDSSDDKKFVALMLIPKIADLNDLSCMAFVFEKMNFDFLLRLLNAKGDSN